MLLSLEMDSLPPGKALGKVQIPGSKSVTNRALLLAAQCEGRSLLRAGLESEDTRWMREALRDLGTSVEESEVGWIIQGGARPAPTKPLWLGASGSTLRFLLPWLAVEAKSPVTLHGEVRLFERPLAPLIESLQSLGAHWQRQVQGGVLHPSTTPPERLEVTIEAALSSQFVTGLALAAAGRPQGGRLQWKGEAASRSYLELTAHWLARFGCESRLERHSWEIPGGCLQARSVELPADWSGAAAFLCAAAVSGRAIRLGPLDFQDPQGDRELLAILQQAGCRAVWEGQSLWFSGPLLRGIQADLTNCPDLAPVLAATAALAPSPSLLSGLHTLPLKECDRLEASAELARWLGANVEILSPAALRIHPGPLPGLRAPFDPRADHRMAFAAALGGLRCGGELRDPGCVAKTFPTFWETWHTMLEGP